ncbi:bifunctional Translation initiation factor 3 (IF-3) [Babesia duncani]|uniref:Bifunctional Translation initiation factor 3 (IF-3) n=1 Tax=Babesia duncani TaxID=323732 RepID=A0AAD9PLJ3_9APIC|nr:bifunctional Translation initiation factor 3 (IF-3) [Babesia duncani]
MIHFPKLYIYSANSVAKFKQWQYTASLFHSVVEGNREITCERVRLLRDKQFIGDFTIEAAREKAIQLKCNLILFKPHATPPICVLEKLDTFLEQQKQNVKAPAYSFDPSLKVKTIQISKDCADADFKRKIQNARKFIQDGHRVEVIIYSKSIKSTRPLRGKPGENTGAIEKSMDVTKASEIMKSLHKALHAAHEKGLDLAFSLNNPLVQRIDYVYTQLCDIAKPFTALNIIKKYALKYTNLRYFNPSIESAKNTKIYKFVP